MAKLYATASELFILLIQASKIDLGLFIKRKTKSLNNTVGAHLLLQNYEVINPIYCVILVE